MVDLGLSCGHYKYSTLTLNTQYHDIKHFGSSFSFRHYDLVISKKNLKYKKIIGYLLMLIAERLTVLLQKVSTHIQL